MTSLDKSLSRGLKIERRDYVVLLADAHGSQRNPRLGLDDRRRPSHAHQLRSDTLPRKRCRDIEMIDVAAVLHVGISNGLALMLHDEGGNGSHPLCPRLEINGHGCPGIYLLHRVVPNGNAVDGRQEYLVERRFVAHAKIASDHSPPPACRRVARQPLSRWVPCVTAAPARNAAATKVTSASSSSVAPALRAAPR